MTKKTIVKQNDTYDFVLFDGKNGVRQNDQVL